MENSENYKFFHPFVRCVGAASALSQLTAHKAYDYRMIAVVKGSGFLETDCGRQEIENGNVFIISPGTAYRLVTDKEQRIIVINFDMTHSHCHISTPVISVFSELFDESKIIEKNCPVSFFDKNVFLIKNASSECIRLCEAVLEAYKSRTVNADDLLITGLFTQLFYLLTKKEKSSAKNSTANGIYRYITENFHQQITLESLSEKFHFHPTYINRLMQKHYKTSVKQLLLKCRFERAVYLLDNTDMTVKEIASISGFSNPQYFSEAFFNRFGYYPTLYRK